MGTTFILFNGQLSCLIDYMGQSFSADLKAHDVSKGELMSSNQEEAGKF